MLDYSLPEIMSTVTSTAEWKVTMMKKKQITLKKYL
jgi:hypothetical protein